MTTIPSEWQDFYYIITPPHLGLLKVSGTRAKELLQGQLTCDVNEVTSTQIKLGAHCNPQGRIISLFQLFFYQDDYYLQMPRNMIAIALAALKKYAVFFKVELTDASDNVETIDFPDIKLKNGIGMIYPETSEKFLPHEINLHLQNGISFTKGCYTGQEIIARMQYRGKLKNKLCVYHIDSPLEPKRGSDFNDERNIAGTIVDFYTVKPNNYQLLLLTSKNR